MKIKEAMTRHLITIPSGASSLEAYRLMQEKRIRHLPVVGETGEDIVGVLSQRNLVHLPSSAKVPVEYIMSTPIEHMHQDTPLKTAVLRMLEKKISCLLVTDNEETVMGLVTTDDLLWQFSRLLEETDKTALGVPNAIRLQTLGDIAYRLSLAGI